MLFDPFDLYDQFDLAVSRFHSHINTAVTILSAYQGGSPFAATLKTFFSSQKKYGSRDRRSIAHLCYCFFRTGHVTRELTLEKRIIAGLFLCSTGPNEILENLEPALNANTILSPEKKFELLKINEPVTALFPFGDELSEGINPEKFASSLLTQPDLFLRIRPGFKAIVIQKLQKDRIQFKQVGEDCLALPISTKIESVLTPDNEVVIQDMSSQGVGKFLKKAFELPTTPLRVWDCCAGSGGKSIMARDILGEMELTVSDIRESILVNLKKRFRVAGIDHYTSGLLDHSPGGLVVKPNSFSLIIADIPCTGSGTWGRTPEQLFYFDQEEIGKYVSLQEKIVSDIMPILTPGGSLLYITCSVFTRENEGMVTFIKEKFHAEPVSMELLKGYEDKADTLFAALLKKQL